MCRQQMNPTEQHDQHSSGSQQPGQLLLPKPDAALLLSSNDEHNQQLFELLVTGVPTTFTEQELLPALKQYGDVLQLHIIRDKSTGQSRGGALLSYATKQQAEHALKGLSSLELAGATAPLLVQYANAEDDVLQRRASLRESTDSTTSQQHQQVTSLGGGLQQQSSLGAAADPPERQQQQQEEQPERFTLFFAKVCRSSTAQEVRQVLSRFGEVLKLDLFAEYPGAPSSKGCGLVVYGEEAAASAAIATLNNKYTWSGMRTPMIVKRITSPPQKQREQQSSQSQLSQGPPAALQPGSHSSDANSSTGVPSECHHGEVPTGCAPDAFKLLVGNIPKHCTEQELRQVLETVAPIVELVMLRDNSNQQPKGCAFVWYATANDAHKAIQQLNHTAVLPAHGRSLNYKPLLVLEASAHATAAAVPSAAAAAVAARSGKLAMQQHQKQQLGWQQAPAQSAVHSASLQAAAVQQQQQLQQHHWTRGAATSAGVLPVSSAVVPAAMRTGYLEHARSLGNASSTSSPAYSMSAPSPGQQLQQQHSGSTLTPMPAGAVGSYGQGLLVGSHATTGVGRTSVDSLGASPMMPAGSGVAISSVSADPIAVAMPAGVQCQLVAVGNAPNVSYMMMQPQQQLSVGAYMDQQPQQQATCASSYVLLQPQQQTQTTHQLQVACSHPQFQTPQQWQHAPQALVQQQQQPYGYHASVCYPAASAGIAEQLQPDFEVLTLGSGQFDPASLVCGAAAQTQQQPAGPTVIGSSSCSMNAAATSAALCSTGLLPSPTKPGYVAGENAAESPELSTAVHNSNLEIKSVHVSVELAPRVPLDQCVAIISSHLETLSSVSGATVNLLVGTSYEGGVKLVVSLSGTPAQATAAYSSLCVLLHQCDVATLMSGRTIQSPS